MCQTLRGLLKFWTKIEQEVIDLTGKIEKWLPWKDCKSRYKMKVRVFKRHCAGTSDMLIHYGYHQFINSLLFSVKNCLLTFMALKIIFPKWNFFFPQTESEKSSHIHQARLATLLVLKFKRLFASIIQKDNIRDILEIDIMYLIYYNIT